MKKLIGSAAFILFMGMGVFAQDEAKQTGDAAEVNLNAPALAFTKEVHDFGTIEEGLKYTHEFTFINTGKEPLIIKNVRASCGCTTPIWPKEPILPGQEGVVKAVYNSKGRPGKFNKAITITSNASTPTKVVYIKGNVTKSTSSGVPEKKPSMMAEPDKD
ncbi:MAG: DUF1573 domain-containing protein [Bacteroidetes bacterium]|nr:DUF1573 domain-containing protein [Bacteroidota bacterium]